MVEVLISEPGVNAAQLLAAEELVRSAFGSAFRSHDWLHAVDGVHVVLSDAHVEKLGRCGWCSPFLIAPRAQSLSNLVEIELPCGDADREIKAFIFRRTNPLTVDGKERPAGGPRKALVPVQ